MRRVALAAGLALAACHAPAPAAVTAAPTAGVSIALYDTYALVDDRRWVDVAGGRLVLEHVDPGASLASLEIEALGGPRGALRLGACSRDVLPELAPVPGERRLSPPAAPRFAPAVRCAVTGPPGRYLVRVAYVSTALGYRAEHEVAMTAPDHARVVSRFAIATPAWGTRAELVVYDGVPGGARLPHEVARGAALLDGSVAVIELPRREVPAELRRVYMGGTDLHSAANETAGSEPSELGSTQDVWVWLDLHLRLAPGPLRVHVDLPGEGVRDVDVPAERRRQPDTGDAPLGLPLWIDPELRGMRQRFADYSEGSTLAERFLLTVANTGETPREVWIEERLRPLRRRKLVRAWPGKPAIAGDVVRAKVVVKAGKLERVGFTIAYWN